MTSTVTIRSAPRWAPRILNATLSCSATRPLSSTVPSRRLWWVLPEQHQFSQQADRIVAIDHVPGDLDTVQ
ncbi:hypothetical protein, partial [Skermanella aerolata]|uniref:hypothetical protein n=1 Tax=Skermanella aerolata TaxID=393310 RepID=UPI001B3BC666